MSEHETHNDLDLAGLERRAFLLTAGRHTFWGLLAAMAGGGAARAGEPGPWLPLDEPPWECTPAFGVAARNPEQQVMAAIIETVLPGAATDPAGTIGALEAGALDLAYDRYYPLRDYIPVIVQLIEAAARSHGGGGFASLDRETREAILNEVQHSLPFLRHAYRFIRSVYYADLHGCVGSRELGFPGPNLGYVNHPAFSYRRPMSQERTPDGHLP